MSAPDTPTPHSRRSPDLDALAAAIGVTVFGLPERQVADRLGVTPSSGHRLGTLQRHQHLQPQLDALVERCRVRRAGRVLRDALGPEAVGLEVVAA